jgi:hypothetical protein
MPFPPSFKYFYLENSRNQPIDFLKEKQDTEKKWIYPIFSVVYQRAYADRVGG